MMLNFKINIESNNQETVSIENVSDNVEKFITQKKTLLDNIAKLIQQQIQYNLFHSLDYKGNTVVPDSPLTVKRKGHAKVFFETGELYRSVLMNVVSNDEREIFIGDTRGYIASWLHYGTKRMPARPFFGISNETYEKVNQILFNNINK